MIEKATIKNFRCFSAEEVSGLTRVNLVVGRNASGKTTFLESIFISSAAASPQLAFQMRSYRQLGNQIQLSAEPSIMSALWKDLFHWLDEDQLISIELQGSNNDSRFLRIYYGGIADQTLPFSKQSSSQPPNPTVFPQINFEWQRGSNPPTIIKPKFTPIGLSFEGATVDHFPILMFGPHIAEPPQEDARRYSELSKTGDNEAIDEAIREEFPFIASLGIEFSVSVPMIFASFKDSRGKLPINVVSDGISRLLSILIGIATYKDGIILIDQIEDGFYFDRIPSIWKVIHKFSVKKNVQIIATTHSNECLKGLRGAMKGNENDFSLIRAERQTGFSTLKLLKGKFLESALENGFDVR